MYGRRHDQRRRVMVANVPITSLLDYMTHHSSYPIVVGNFNAERRGAII